MAYQFAKQSAKATFGFGLGVASGVSFVSFLDDLIYSDLRKNVFMSYKMVSMTSGSQADSKLEQAKSVAQGTIKFFDKIKPQALIPGNAKELMLKDADYSTPQDHYFAYIQRRRSQGFNEQKEAEQVMQGLDVDQDQLSKAIRRQMIYGDVLTDRE